MSTDRELRKGSAETLILALLEERDRHGYEIAKLIDSRSAGALKFHVASLYPTLYRLERRGLIQGSGSRRPACAGAASTGSPPRARRSSTPSAEAGARSSPP